MKINFTTLAKKYGKNVSILVAGLFIGGISVQAVNAAIPAGSGSISACRNETSGALRVIDGATQSCDTGEANLSWNQNGVAGYARFIYNPETDGYTIDSNRSSNVTNVYTVGASNFVCITLAGTPRSVSVQAEDYNSASDFAGLKDVNGWTGPFSGCDEGGANVGVMLQAPANFTVNIF